MRTVAAGSIALTVAIAMGGICHAQVVVKQEPLDMRNGATVLVDDGTCPKGMIKLVTGTHGMAMSGASLHTAKCISRTNR
jgi:hypothetical protein